MPSPFFAGNPVDLSSLDVDGDAISDLVVLDASDGLHVYFGDGSDGRGNGLFSTRIVQSGLPTALTDLAIADFDTDDRPDVAVASGSGVHLLSNDGVAFSAPTPVAVGFAATRLATGDINDDGTADLVTLDDAGIRIVLGNEIDGRADGSFTLVPTSFSASSPVSLALADFDDDGILDIAVGTATGELDIRLGGGSNGRGDGDFSSSVAVPSTLGRLDCLIAVDINRDGITDLIGAGSNSSSVVTFVGDGLDGRGNGSFLPPVTSDIGHHAADVAVADLDRDGAMDLAVPDASGSAVTVLLGDGEP